MIDAFADMTPGDVDIKGMSPLLIAMVGMSRDVLTSKIVEDTMYDVCKMGTDGR